jgi:acetyltransferase
VETELEDRIEGFMPPPVLARILSAYNIPVQPFESAESLAGAAAAARRIGYPVVLKTANPDIVHKTDVGGVHINIPDETSLTSAYEKLSELGPSVLVQKMADPGMEWLVGGRQDPQFGPIVVVGVGGVHVEILKETQIRVAPVSYEEASRLLDMFKGSAFFQTVRGADPLDREAFLEIIVRVSWLLHDYPRIQELDLNPVRVFPQGCCALDWRATIGN